MTERNNLAYFVDMREYAIALTDMLRDVSLDELERGQEKRWAVERVFQIIGEAANRVPQSVRERHPSIAWHQIIGTRNRLAHEYNDISIEILWNAAQSDIPKLIQQLTAIIADANPP